MRQLAIVGLAVLLLLATQSVRALPYHALTTGNTPWHSLQLVRQAPPLPGKEQLLAQLAAVAGDEALGCSQRRPLPAFEAHTRWRDALPVLDEAMRDRRVVMLNESHDRSRHRAFLQQLIDLLHAQGVRALAAETFADDVVAGTADGRVRAGSGVYTRDPVFAAAVRHALALGWELLPYEASAHAASREARERMQAQRLADWLQAHPQQRLLVYVGGSHLDKRSEAGWMASHLVAMTGTEPLAIRQGATACTGDDPAAWPTPPQAGVQAVVDAGRAPTAEADWVVVHLPVPGVDARPGWLATLPGRVPLHLCVPPSVEPALLRVFDAGSDDQQVIAADQFPLAEGQAQATAWVLPGHYRIELEHADGTRQLLGQVELDAAATQGQSCLSPG